MNLLVVGGCGYIGALLVPQLLADGHKVTVYDTAWFGNGSLPENGNLRFIKGDVRSVKTMDDAAKGQDAVICLASISSESMCQENKTLAKTVNMGGMMSVALSAHKAKVKRFIYASSVAVYGTLNAKETDIPNPTTIYGETKLDGEGRVLSVIPEAVIIRSASVCGYSPHQRFDLTVNKMTHDAMRKGVITVAGGSQVRCHIHIRDICDVYKTLLSAPAKSVEGEVFNVVAENMAVRDTAQTVGEITAAKVEFIERTDQRSYSVDGSKIIERLGFFPSKWVSDAVEDLKARFDAGYWPDSLTNPLYQNMAYGIPQTS